MVTVSRRFFHTSAAHAIARTFSSKSLASIKEPKQIADFVIEQLSHSTLLGQSDACAAAQYDLTGEVLPRARRFLEKVGAKKVGNLLENGKHFHLDKIGLDEFDALVISRVLRFHNPHIELLDLNGNPEITDTGLEFFARPEIQLKSLFLSGCEISDAGVDVYAAALAKTKHMGILELRKNKISDRGVASLARALLDNPYLESFNLYLSGNADISDEGALELAKVSLAKKFKVWLLDCPKVTPEFRAEIAQHTRNIRL